jgi:hypothetical protein
MVDQADGWTMDIDNARIVGAFPVRGDDGMLMVTPAKESKKGRGQPVFDVYHPGLPCEKTGLIVPVLISLKITRSGIDSKDQRKPRNAVITTGDPTRHLIGVLRAVREMATDLPLICLHYSEREDQWYQLQIDAARILRAHRLDFEEGDHGDRTEHKALTSSTATRKSGHDDFGASRYIDYTSIRINIAPAIKAGYTRGWVKVAAPTLPDMAP